MFALEGSSPSSCIFLFVQTMERDVKYPIVLGESITSEDKEKLLLRCMHHLYPCCLDSFVPQSLNRSKPAVLSFGEHGINVQATFFDDYVYLCDYLYL